MVREGALQLAQASTQAVSPPLSCYRRRAINAFQSPGNAALSAARTGLPKDSVVSVSQIVTIDRELLTERIGRLPDSLLSRILAGIDLVLGRA